MSEFGPRFDPFVSVVAGSDFLAIDPIDSGVRVNPEFLAAKARLRITRILLPIVTVATLAGVGVVVDRLARGVPADIVDAITNGGRVTLAGPSIFQTYMGVGTTFHLGVWSGGYARRGSFFR